MDDPDVCYLCMIVVSTLSLLFPAEVHILIVLVLVAFSVRLHMALIFQSYDVEDAMRREEITRG